MNDLQIELVSMLARVRVIARHMQDIEIELSGILGAEPENEKMPEENNVIMPQKEQSP